MNLRYIKEPLLEFGRGGRFECPRQGIYNFAPYDIDKQVRPEKINVGIIGRSDSVDEVLDWLKNCRDKVVAPVQRQAKHPKLYPNFCGFNKDNGFYSELAFDETYTKKINNSDFDKIIKEYNNLEDRITEVADLYLSHIKFLSKNKRPDVIICVLPEKLVPLLNQQVDLKKDSEDILDDLQDSLEDEGNSEREQNFRSLLKAKSMQYNVPIQIIRDRITKPSGEMQDPSTIAWNIFTALYYKASGIPWAMVKSSNIVCYAGIGFYKSRDRQTTQTSVAQIFNELGKGVILRGGEVTIKRNDRTPHLTESQAYEILDNALTEYKEAIGTIPPQRLVLHKTSNFNDAEIAGFEAAAINKHGVGALDLVTINERSGIRLFRENDYPVLRGTHLRLSKENHVLYTRGSVPFYETYTGQYIPNPIEIRLFRHDENPDIICDEILALTKMNWNNTQFDRRLPITIECARNVGAILKYMNDSDPMQLKYSFYM
ncbi:argonaute/piwi family protein [Pontibacter kalidii]|uniref:argonaute/piwi family protein n=1 Tax=Pontibacter kalidii TaxID=2592049 RepID=UPI00225674AF|nr:Piwi domain-containing protein [Pontibacter kalidii]